MRKFIVNLLSNHFGIILAALNVCFFMSKNDVLIKQPFGKLFLCANFPAAISALLSVEFVKIFAHRLAFSTENLLGTTFFVFFCIAQWLLVAYVAKTLAAKIRRPKFQ